MAQAQSDVAVGMLRGESLRDACEVATEELPAIELRPFRYGRIAVTARIHGEDAKVTSKALGHWIPDGRTKAVGMLQQREGSLPSPIEQRDLDGVLR